MFVSRKMLFVIIAVIVVVASLGFWLYSRSVQPSGVVRFFIDRSVIKEGENATLTVFVENFDLRTHFVEYSFKVSHRVLIYEGAERLLPRNGSEYTFNYTLGAADPSETKAFVVVGTLEEGISSATYPIALTVYFDRGTATETKLEKTWNDLILKVEE